MTHIQVNLIDDSKISVNLHLSWCDEINLTTLLKHTKVLMIKKSLASPKKVQPHLGSIQLQIHDTQIEVEHMPQDMHCT